MVPFILNLLDSSNVVMVLSQLLLVTQAVIPVTQLFIPIKTKISTALKPAPLFNLKAGATTMNNGKDHKSAFIRDSLTGRS